MSINTSPDFTTIRTIVTYGFLYNYYAVSDIRYISNYGWHVPTYNEFLTLSNYLGGNTVSGGKLKDTDSSYWLTPNTGATNEVSFNLRGGGYLDTTFGFSYIKERIRVWTTTASLGDPNRLVCLIVNYNSASINLNSISGYLKRDGHYLRLIKDSTSLSNGQEGIYIGNDGKIYRTICIGTQEWLADDLAETKYRNGDIIPEETNYSNWPPLSTGVFCAYNNNWNNSYI